MHNPPRILIVDDIETNRDILDARLRSHGYELIQAADAEEAMVATMRHQPDLVALDVIMPPGAPGSPCPDTGGGPDRRRARALVLL
jgi:CheY-like chemotaxis protein